METVNTNDIKTNNTITENLITTLNSSISINTNSSNSNIVDSNITTANISNLTSSNTCYATNVNSETLTASTLTLMPSTRIFEPLNLEINGYFVHKDVFFIYDNNATIRIGKFAEWVYASNYEFKATVFGFVNINTRRAKLSTNWFYANFNRRVNNWIVFSYISAAGYEFKCFDYLYQTNYHQVNETNKNANITYSDNSDRPIVCGSVLISNTVNLYEFNTNIDGFQYNLFNPATYLIKISNNDNNPMPCYIIRNNNTETVDISNTYLLIKFIDVEMVINDD